MLLSQVSGIGNFRLLRDGPFEAVGFLSDPQPNMLVFGEAPKFIQILRKTHVATCLITTPGLAEQANYVEGLGVCKDPRLAFDCVHEFLARTDFYWSDFTTEIHPSACIHPRAFIAPRSVRIGAETVIEPNVSLLERCVIGSRAVIRSGAVLGSVGFQTTFDGTETNEMIHAGSVLVGDRVHILANSVIAGGVFRQATTIGDDARIGAGAFISHNVQIGTRSFVGHGAVINGNAKIGSRTWVGPSSSIANGISIGDDAHVALGSVVISDIEAGSRVAGNFAVPQRALLRHVASMRQ